MDARVVFVHAPDPEAASRQDYGATFMPVWVPVLAARLPAGSAAGFVDTRTGSLEDAAGADVYLYSGINQDLDSVLAARSRLAARHPDAVHVIGGPVTWSLDQSGELALLDSFDVIAIGDGEEIVASLVQEAAARTSPKVVRAPRRFPVADAIPMDDATVTALAGNYYGAVVEVSRGCPFLCEFCDIRILPDNNRPHGVDPALVVAEVDRLARLGVRQVMLACDNLVGDPAWAMRLCDALITWRRQTGNTPVFYTWVTLTLARMPELSAKMRQAGFDSLFIGVESFSSNSLAETAKLQNSSMPVVDALRSIAAYGFIVKAGLIAGFDSDRQDVFDLTLAGLRDSGVLPADIGFLVALPGTPLHRRMRLAGRLRSQEAVTRRKASSNILYLQDSSALASGFVKFQKDANRGREAYARLDMLMGMLESSDVLEPVAGGGYASPGAFLRQAMRSRPAAVHLGRLLLRLASRPSRPYWAARGVLRCWKARKQVSQWRTYTAFWGYSWATGLLLADGLTVDDVDIASLAQVSASSILPDGYDGVEGEPIPLAKSAAQRRATIRSLQGLIDDLDELRPDSR
jgi:hypothetical protein